MLSKLKSDLKNFILTKNKIGSNVVRSILSTITNDGLKDSATEEEIVNIVKKEIKKRIGKFRETYFKYFNVWNMIDSLFDIGN